MKYFRRFLILLIIIIYNECFNLFAIKDIYIGPLTVWNFVTILAIAYLILEYFVGKIKYTNIENKKAIRWINWLVFFIILVTFTMPMRGETLGNAFLMSHKVLLPYIMVHLFIIDIIRTNSTSFLEKTLIYSSIIFSIVYVATFFFPNMFINQLGFAYIVVSFVLVYWKDYFKKNNKFTILVMVILLVGVFAQPFRAYAFSSIAILISFTFLRKQYKKIMKYMFVFTILFAIAVPVSKNFGEYSISKQIDTLISDLTVGGDKSSTGARLVYDLMYRIPMIEKSPWFGYGYVYPRSEHAKKLGFSLSSDRDIYIYNLFTVDSGYLTFLTTFGFIGTLLLLFLYIRVAILVYKSKTYNYYKYTFLTILIVFIFVTYTHHPLMTDFGIIPLMIILALTTKKADYVS